ncbi:MAG: amino acid permease [Saprospiraceae bacterium]|nr:amino acid permease [Saprospiraceae bacterium]
MQNYQEDKKFGTAPVFFTAISTILGAIMFLRFGFSVGHVGLIGTILIILIGHAVTIPTAMSIAEIATNQKVEGGGEYYIISRSFGLVIGSTIGIALYFSQAISVAFYIIAFTEAFTTPLQYIFEQFNPPAWVVWLLEQKQTIGIPALLGLTYIMLTKGADLGIKTLYAVVAILGISMAAFFLGSTEYEKKHSLDPTATIYNTEWVQDTLLVNKPLPSESRDSGSVLNEVTVIEPRQTPANPDRPTAPLGFFIVFAIIFPAFTGMTAGVGLSGDLKDPGRSLPLGTMTATIAGMIVYIFIAFKLADSASPQDLSDTSKLIMADIAWQGWWIIPIGLAAATISSALGSIMVAPRTLQAIARDRMFPTPLLNQWLSQGKGGRDEPFNASVVTIVIAGAFIMAGALDSVAQIISMFFMVTYGSLCLISFLSHFAADPSYRPRFKSRWYISLFGALSCFGLMFFMNGFYAILAIIAIVVLHFGISFFNPDKKSMALIFQGVIFQLSRQLQVFLQKADKEQASSWRPSAVAFSESTFERLGAFDLLRWISQKYGFGTYIHRINGYISKQTRREAQKCKGRLINMAEATDSNIYVDTLITPSYTAGVAQVIQLPGIAGTENNLMLFEFSKSTPDNLPDIIDNFKLIHTLDFDVIILGTTERAFGLRKQIHIWITATDYNNANLMILLAYIILGHREWRGAEIKIFTMCTEEGMEAERNKLYGLINAGQLPISPHNVEFIARKPEIRHRAVITEKSKDADLTIVGLREEALVHRGMEIFDGYQAIGNVLFVNSAQEKKIK